MKKKIGKAIAHAKSSKPKMPKSAPMPTAPMPMGDPMAGGPPQGQEDPAVQQMIASMMRGKK